MPGEFNWKSMPKSRFFLFYVHCLKMQTLFLGQTRDQVKMAVLIIYNFMFARYQAKSMSYQQQTINDDG